MALRGRARMRVGAAQTETRGFVYGYVGDCQSENCAGAYISPNGTKETRISRTCPLYSRGTALIGIARQVARPLPSIDEARRAIAARKNEQALQKHAVRG